jgi:hypothetical protein
VRDLVLLGTGIGITLPLYLNSAQASVGPRLVGVATSQVQFFRQVGGTIGVAVLGSLLSARLPAQAGAGVRPDLAGPVRAALAAGLHDVFVVAMLCAVVAITVSLFLKEVRLSQRGKPSQTQLAEAAD